VHTLLDLLFARSLRTRLHPQAERNVFEHSHVFEQSIMLKDEADLAFAHVLIRCVLAFEQHLARILPFEAGDDAQ